MTASDVPSPTKAAVGFPRTAPIRGTQPICDDLHFHCAAPPLCPVTAQGVPRPVKAGAKGTFTPSASALGCHCAADFRSGKISSVQRPGSAAKSLRYVPGASVGNGGIGLACRRAYRSLVLNPAHSNLGRIMPPQDPAILRWWPTTQSLDLVEGPITAVAGAVRGEVERFAGGERFICEWRKFTSFDDALCSADYFANFPTIFVIMPTVSKWVAIWNNHFLCDGYYALCYNLTRRHGFTTMHWSAHDKLTTFQSGATFTYERREGDEIQTRSVYVAQDCGRWAFHESGQALPEEDVPGYLKRRKRDRLNESRMLDLLRNLGARPWSEDFYDFAGSASNVLRRPSLPEAIRLSKRARSDVVKP
jgi:hypothetical protein